MFGNDEDDKKSEKSEDGEEETQTVTAADETDADGTTEKRVSSSQEGSSSSSEEKKKTLLRLRHDQQLLDVLEDSDEEEEEGSGELEESDLYAGDGDDLQEDSEEEEDDEEEGDDADASHFAGLEALLKLMPKLVKETQRPDRPSGGEGPKSLEEVKVKNLLIKEGEGRYYVIEDSADPWQDYLEGESDEEEEGEEEFKIIKKEMELGSDLGYPGIDESEEEGTLNDGEGDDEEAALIAERLERERQRAERLAQIKRKKESLIERYLKMARILLAHRKKNIYLQDYLYHLGSRKGILRGDPGTLQPEDDTVATALNKHQKRKQKRKNALMAARFARFLRKTGHFFDEEQANQHHLHHHQHQHHHHQPAHKHHPFQFPKNEDDLFRDQLKAEYKSHHLQLKKGSNLTRVRKAGFGVHSKNCFGKACEKSKGKFLHKKSSRKFPAKKLTAGAKRPGSDEHTIRGRSHRPYKRVLTLKEQLERKAAAALKKANAHKNHAHKGLAEYEQHRCRMARKSQLIKISKLLERQYAGTILLDSERTHLISFVEHSVTAQNLAKRKAMRRQQKPEKSGVVNLNHQWTRSLERIRELRLEKSKLEQEHKLQLIKKVKHWHVWEKRDLIAVDAVSDFITNMSSRVIMTKRETETFSTGMQQFRKQLRSLFEAMITQLVKMNRVKNTLLMVQRKVKDSASVISMEGLTFADYERMVVENQESHEKLVEKQADLLEGYEKLKRYMGAVAKSHLKKQRTWGALRAGHHDTKALWDLCTVERENLLKKLREIKKSNRFRETWFMRTSILENKTCFIDYQRVKHRVEELKDMKRVTQTKLHQAQSTFRAFNVKMNDIQQRTKAKSQQNSMKVTAEGIAEWKSNAIGQDCIPIKQRHTGAQRKCQC